jgi:hypothetical protein
MFLPEISKILCMPFTAVTHVAVLYLNALLTSKAESSHIYLVGSRVLPTVSLVEWQLVLPLKTVIRNEASRCRLEQRVLKYEQLKIKSLLRKIHNKNTTHIGEVSLYIFGFIGVIRCNVILFDRGTLYLRSNKAVYKTTGLSKVSNKTN